MVGNQTQDGMEACRWVRNSQSHLLLEGNLFYPLCLEGKSLCQPSYRWSFVSYDVLYYACFETKPAIQNNDMSLIVMELFKTSNRLMRTEMIK